MDGVECRSWVVAHTKNGVVVVAVVHTNSMDVVAAASMNWTSWAHCTKAMAAIECCAIGLGHLLLIDKNSVNQFAKYIFRGRVNESSSYDLRTGVSQISTALPQGKIFGANDSLHTARGALSIFEIAHL